MAPIAISFSGLTANGTSGSVTTTELTLGFDKDPVGLTLAEITLTGASKGALSGSGTTRTLTISGITVGNGGSVEVALASPTGYSISPSAKNTTVFVSYREFVTVPTGSYSQQPVTGNTFSHTVSGFRLARFQVTYELWHEVYTWATNDGYKFKNPGQEGNNGEIGLSPSTRRHEPVSTINWRDAIVWCNAYSQKEGLTPVYYIDSEFTTPLKNSSAGGVSIDTTPGSFDNPFVNWAANGYRLPTEGEWQYAASYKNGSDWTLFDHASGATANYNDATETGLVAWYYANAGSKTHNVGTKSPNALGIYDMSGNIVEWCWDWYGDWSTASKTDFRGPDTGAQRIERGGSYGSDAANLRVGYRYFTSPSNGFSNLGFRLARSVE